MNTTEQPRDRFSHAPGDASRRNRYGSPTALPSNLIRVPPVKQRTDFSCGNAATLAVLRYWLWEVYARVDEAALYLPLETTHARGTEPQPIAAFLNSGGIAAEYRHGNVTVEDLERAVDRREPPIVDLQAWRDQETPWRDVWDAGHYVVMVGYDEERLFFMDPCNMAPGAYAYLPTAELAERWHDLAGDHNERIERMAIFARGASGPPLHAEPMPQCVVKLG